MNQPLKLGRHCEIVPMDGSHYVYVDGEPWSRHDTLAIAECVRQTIVDSWAAEYERRFDEYERHMKRPSGRC